MILAREAPNASPPPARAARGGKGSGAGGLSTRASARSETAEPPPTPDPSPPLRGRRGAERVAGDGEDSSTRVGKNPASVLPAPVGAISSADRASRAFASSAS